MPQPTKSRKKWQSREKNRKRKKKRKREKREREIERESKEENRSKVERNERGERIRRKSKHVCSMLEHDKPRILSEERRSCCEIIAGASIGNPR